MNLILDCIRTVPSTTVSFFRFSTFMVLRGYKQEVGNGPPPIFVGSMSASREHRLGR